LDTRCERKQAGTANKPGRTVVTSGSHISNIPGGGTEEDAQLAKLNMLLLMDGEDIVDSIEVQPVVKKVQPELLF